MELTSPAFKTSDTIPAQYSCDGDNLSPPLSISGVPAGSQSLALIVDDPDAPGGDWVHWLVWNLDPRTTSIPEHALPPTAVQGLNDFGGQSYGGPCPPSGTHRYQFKLYALDTSLDLSPLATKPKLEAALKNHILAQTMLLGLYRRR